MNQYGSSSHIDEIGKVGSGKAFDEIESNPAGETFNHLKTAVSNSVRNAAGSLARVANQTDLQEAGVSRYGAQAAAWLNRSADYIEEFEPQQTVTQLKQEVQRNPGRSLLIAGAAGLILGALFRRR
jgi:hypothetical protein